MQIKITGKNFDIGEALRKHIEDKLQQFKQKYFEGSVHAHVFVVKQRAGFQTDCSLHLATGLTLQAHGEAAEAYASFDGASQHLEKQLTRYKQRLKDHHRNRREPARFEEAASYVIQASDEAEGAAEPSDLNPVVIAESITSVPELSVGEAVMALEISSVPFVLFRNAKGGQTNVVYRRSDGNIGWVEPRPAA
jgi:ribosomal subunit interface protein